VANGDSYTVEIKPAARKEVEALPDNVLARVVAKLETLRIFPRPVGCKKLKGLQVPAPRRKEVRRW
jgi:mRNA-degrading endonuclease RelE of RelBE toxin-antitoxin system